MKWETVELGDISLSIQTGPFGSQLHQSDYSDIGTPVVMPKDLVNGKIDELSIARVDDGHVERLGRHKIKLGDIIYSRRGDVGKCAYATSKEEGWLCGTGCLKVSVDEKRADAKFVFYQLQLPSTVGWVVNHAVGSTMLNLNTSILSHVPITLPSLQLQSKIMSILSVYDDLIENNQKQIKLLEEAAQRLYKEWFVDLRFPGHENVKIVDGVPEGWHLKKLEEIIYHEIGGGWGEELPTKDSNKPAYVIRGADIQSITNGGFIGLPYRFHSISSLKERLLKPFDIIFEVSGGSKTEGVAKVCLINNDILNELDNVAICASFCKLIRINDNRISTVLYQALRYLRNTKQTEIYDKRSASSIVNFRWKDFLREQLVLIPSEKDIDRISNSFNKIYSDILVKSIQIVKLKEARDRLLPKLMSGEIEL